MSGALIAANSSAVMSSFAHGIYVDKYAMKDEAGKVIEDWPDTAKRVVFNVLGALGYEEGSYEYDRLLELVTLRKFMPGGRYLYASGRPLHQTQNCLLLKAEDTREGWADLSAKSEMALMTGAGIGVDYSALRASGAKIKKTGGVSSGPLAKMKIINEIGRNVMQGGSRRSAIWAGLNWAHNDILKFINSKNWPEVVIKAKEQDFFFPADLDMTNISVILDDLFFEALEDESFQIVDKDGEFVLPPTKDSWHEHAKNIFDITTRQMIQTAEPGFSIDTGDNAGETLRNAPVAGGTRVLTDKGISTVANIVGTPTSVWTGSQFAPDVVFKRTGENVETIEITMTGGRTITCDPSHPFIVERYVGAGSRRRLDRTDRVPADELREGDVISVSLPDVEVGPLDALAYREGYAYGDGSFCSDTKTDITFCSAESKNCIPTCGDPKSGVLKDSRGYSRFYYDLPRRTRTKDRLDYIGSNTQVASIIAGLFDADGNISTDGRIRLSNKSKVFLNDVARLLEQIGILSHVSKNGYSTYGESQTYQLVISSDYHNKFVNLIPTVRVIGSERGESYRDSLVKVTSITSGSPQDVFCADVLVDEHTFMAEGILVSNCTEVTSSDDSDICNLGSINLARIEDKEEFREVVELSCLFLLAGTVYSHTPYDKVDEIRTKNRRLGLGLMGIHEWLLRHGKKYGPDPQLAEWLDIYSQSTDIAGELADRHGLSRPIKTRAIAPTGTIGIVAETTTGIEPIFCAAYKRRVREANPEGDLVRSVFVVDPTAKRLLDYGVQPDHIEDAYELSYDVERRIEFQAWVQKWVDHGISSTINLPYPIVDELEVEDFKRILIKYLPEIRGVTAYPDGARHGQPITPVPLEYAIAQEGVIVEESEEKCVGGTCGA